MEVIELCFNGDSNEFFKSVESRGECGERQPGSTLSLPSPA